MSHARDGAGRIAQVAAGAGGAARAVAAGFTYRPFGPASGHQWGNGRPHGRDFDADGRETGHPLQSCAVS